MYMCAYEAHTTHKCTEEEGGSYNVTFAILAAAEGCTGVNLT